METSGALPIEARESVVELDRRAHPGIEVALVQPTHLADHVAARDPLLALHRNDEGTLATIARAQVDSARRASRAPAAWRERRWKLLRNHDSRAAAIAVASARTLCTAAGH